MDNLTPKYYLDVKKWFILPGKNKNKNAFSLQWAEFKKLKRSDFEYWRANSAINFEADEWRSGFNYYSPYLLIGEANDVLMIDVDDRELFGRLGAIQTPGVVTYSGGHFFFKYDKELAELIKDNLKFRDRKLEVRVSGITPLPPHQHPLGKRYEWFYLDKEFQPLPDKWRELILEEINNKPVVERKETEELVRGLDFEFQAFCSKRDIVLPITSGSKYEDFVKTCVGWITNKLGNLGLQKEAIKDEAVRLMLKYVDFGAEEKDTRKKVLGAVNKFYNSDEANRRIVTAEPQVAVTRKSERFAILKERHIDNSIRFTNIETFNLGAGHCFLGQLITIYGRSGSGKSSLVKEILKANSPKFKYRMIYLENTQDSLDEAEFNRWMNINNHYSGNYYLKDHIFALDFKGTPIFSEEKHQSFIDAFIAEKTKQPNYDLNIENCTPQKLIEVVKETLREGIKLIGLDSFTLLRYDNPKKSKPDMVNELIDELGNLLGKHKATLFGIAHSTPQADPNEGDKIRDSSGYLNFSEKAIEIRKPKVEHIHQDIKNFLTNNPMQKDYLIKELWWHKNRPYDKEFGFQYVYNKGTGEMEKITRIDDIKPVKKVEPIIASKIDI